MEIDNRPQETPGLVVSYKLIWMVIGLILALILLLAFFLGRLTAPRAETPPPSPSSPAVSRVPLIQTTGIEQGKMEFTPVGQPPQGQAPQEQPQPASPGQPPSPPQAPQTHTLPLQGQNYNRNNAGSQPDNSGKTEPQNQAPAPNREVNAYFDSVSRAMEGQKYWSGSQGFAEKVAAQVQQGDYSEFSRLSAAYAQMEQKLRAINPPETCREYHRGTIEALQQSQTLMAEMSRVLATQDTAALEKMARESAQLEAKCRQLDQQAAQLQGGGASPEP